jgi:hypothetical protein
VDERAPLDTIINTDCQEGLRKVEHRVWHLPTLMLSAMTATFADRSASQQIVSLSFLISPRSKISVCFSSNKCVTLNLGSVDGVEMSVNLSLY